MLYIEITVRPKKLQWCFTLAGEKIEYLYLTLSTVSCVILLLGLKL